MQLIKQLRKESLKKIFRLKLIPREARLINPLGRRPDRRAQP